MRLLLVINEAYPSFRPDIAALFGRYLPQSGVDSDLVAYRPSGAANSTAWGGGKVLLGPAPEGPLRRMPGRIWHYLFSIWSARRSRYDAIQVRDMPIMAVIALVRARLSRIPFIYWMSFPVPEMEIRMAQEKGLGWGMAKFLMLIARGRFGKLMLYKIVLPGADHIFVQSRAMKQDMEAGGVDAQKMTAVPMCIDPMDFEPDVVTTNGSTPGAAFTMAYLGTCEKARRVDFLFEVLAALRAAGRDIRLLLVGDAWLEQERKFLRDQAAAAKVTDYVTITGWLPADEARRQLRQADLAIAIVPPDPLLDVASPTKIVEYLALGLPVVANDHPDQTDVVVSSGAGLSAPFEVAPFASAVAQMHDNRAAAAAMAAKGPAYVDQYRNYQVTAPQLAMTYKALLWDKAQRRAAGLVT